MKKFLVQKAVFANIIQKRKPKCVYLAWNKYYFAAIAAAQDAGIPVYEFQHGIISNIHIHYTWLSKIAPPLYPNAILFSGPGWENIVRLGGDTKCINIGSQHMELMQKTYCGNPKQKGVIAIFSQQIVGQKLFQFVVEIAKQCPELNFKIKLHPNERYQDLEFYIEDKIPSNITLLSKHYCSYKLMAESEFQIGVSSTTLVEGLKFETKTLVIPLVSWEYLVPWIETDQMKLVTSPDEAAKLLKSDFSKPIPDEIWYGPSQPDNIPLPLKENSN